ncbi:MAG: FAD synthetase [Rikenellaceae bacterium]|nr:FAD synthetase [Rikenellaceae bacterium]
MKIIRGTEKLPPLRSPVVTVGSFDGVHRGHKLLLESTVRRAAETASDSIAVTFDPHPRAVLKPGEKTRLLSTSEEKLLLLAAAGIDYTVVIEFDGEFSRMAPSDFIGQVITGRLRASAMVVGYDHKFGRNKEGDYDFLLGTQALPDIVRVPELKSDGLKISSTAARDAVASGDLDGAGAILGHRYFAVADVMGGSLSLPNPDKLVPPPGRYEVTVGEWPQAGVGKSTFPGEGSRGMLRISPEGGLALENYVPPGGAGKVVIIFL